MRALTRQPRLAAVYRIALAWVFLGNIPSDVGLGSVATVITAVVLVGLLPRTLSGTGRGMPHAPSVLLAFIAIALLWLLAGPHYIAGVQNVLVYVCFGASIRLGAFCAREDTPRRLLRGMTMAAFAAALIYSVIVFGGAGTPTIGPEGPTGIYDPRPFSMVALVGVACALPYIRRARDWIIPIILTGLIAESQSRTSLAIAVMLFTASGLRMRRRWNFMRIGALLVAESAVLWWLFTQFAPIANRFTHNDNTSFLGISGTTGRSEIWPFVWDHAVNNPLWLWLGHGAGSVEHLITTEFIDPAVVHPHDDFLRLLYDYGIVGVIFWLVAFFALLFGCFKRLRRASLPDDRIIHLAAALGLVLLAGEGLTANAIVYMFVMVPVGVLTGVSIGRGQTRSGDGSVTRHLAPSRANATNTTATTRSNTPAVMSVRRSHNANRTSASSAIR